MRRHLWAFAAALLALPSAAAATDLPGTYVVSSCALGDQPIRLSGWYREVPNDPHLDDRCGTANGSFSAHSAGQTTWHGGDRYRWLWKAPPDTAVAGIRAWGQTGSAPGKFGLFYGALRAGDVIIALPGGAMPVENLGLNTTTLSLEYGCSGLEGCLPSDSAPPAPGSGTSVAGATVSRIEMLLRDLVAPEAIGPPTGRLLDAEPISGVVDARVAFRDRGGGTRSLAILVDGQRVAEKSISDQSCRQPSADSVPCPLSGRLDVELDSTTVPDGAHRVELELRDIAGNRTLLGPYPIGVRNTPPPARAAPPPTPGRLTLSRYAVRARYGSRVVVEGALADFDGAPIVGAQIEVASRPLMRNSTFSSGPPVLTDGNGRFTVPVPPGPSRTFRLRYLASEVSGDVVIPAPVKLKVSPTRTRNGRTVRFTGTVVGTDAGTRVELQARAGRKWVPFRTATLSNGKFKARYTFTSTTTSRRYSFRAVVRTDPNFPYASATSPIVKVLVRP